MAVVLDLLILTLALQTLQSPATAMPEFDASKPSVVTLYEKETTVTTLSTENCTDPGNSPTVSLTSVTPTTPCGQICFQVLPCGTEWCVYFFPSMGTLDYRKASAYYVTVTCTANGSSVNKTINVRLTPNTPPIFNPDVSFQTTTLTNTKNVKAGTKIFTVGAVDDNNDTIIYTMTSEPQSSNFQIGSGTGVITAVHDLSSQCSNSITLHVYISDGVNPRVGPQDIVVTLSDPNASPDITNLDRSVQVLESKAVGDSIMTFTPTDEATKQLTYTLSADPPSNLAFFDTSGQDIVVKSTLNYETVATRTTNLTVVAQDASGCTSQPHYLYVTVTDVNEMPQLYPKNAVYTTYEGSVSQSVRSAPSRQVTETVREDLYCDVLRADNKEEIH
ncbi:hypothetical protein C0Q70_07208 [Pomacea canaliculata]|uniref:Cadherin domain-containing protein n=1 Tax=Pomacea canaliculata TaxID=400727 RepID=A0A2T7PEE1_POMCA|nr:hypothetical protein C0Q70_07208 [Pomacea canaliculata]